MDGAVKCYLNGVDADPIVEPFYQGLMRCYERMGKRAEAFSAYRRLKQTLSIVLGIPPMEETRALFQQMLERQKASGIAVDADTQSSSVGIERGTTNVHVIRRRRKR